MFTENRTKVIASPSSDKIIENIFKKAIMIKINSKTKL